MLKVIFLFSTIIGAITAGPSLYASSPLRGVDDSMPVDTDVGIRLPVGFKATIFANKVGQVRHVVAAKSGWVYGALRRRVKGRGAVALYDRDGDGVADERRYFAKGIRGTGLGIYDGHLYFGTDVSILRWKLPAAGGVPEGKPELIAYGFGEKRQHAAKSFALDGKGGLYVNVGAPSNACMVKQRTKGSKGMDPCPILEKFGGVWKFDANSTMQEQSQDGVRYATGIRNAVAIDWNPVVDSLYIVQRGRDQLAELFPDHFTKQQSIERPAEEFHQVAEGADLGWPYSYYDPIASARMIMPEYGGDGVQISDKGQDPVVAFPARWAPNDLLFPRTNMLPEAYRRGAFIAFYGARDQVPLAQKGYRVVFVPMDEKGVVAGGWITFAGGFSGADAAGDAPSVKHRPTGLAEAADGSLYVTSSKSGGCVWKITYVGS